MAKSKPAEQKKKQMNTLPLYILLIVLFVLYILYQNGSAISLVIGIALLLTLIAVIGIETFNGVREYGLKRNVIEIVAVVVAVIAIWFALQFFLSTRYPLDVVPSCSMLPTLQRGDMLLLHGVSTSEQLKAPVINVSGSTYTDIVNQINTEPFSCIAYLQNGNYAKVSQYMMPGYQMGLYTSKNGGSIVQLGSQSGPLTYECGVTNDTFDNGTTRQIVYTTGISVDGQSVSGDRNNSIVVYSTVLQDLFYQEGDSYIVHRVYAILNADGSYYVLTKGDNNPGLDVQYSNFPASLSQVQGKVIASIPYLGYLKLIIASRFVEPAGCNSTIQN